MMAVPRTAARGRRSLLLLISSPQKCTTSIHPSSQQRALHARIKNQQIPDPTPFVPDPATFLKLIGRDMSKHADKFPSWASLFTLTSPQLRDLGVEPPRARKYLLRWRDKFRHGEFGIGGDLTKVNENGEAEIALVEVPWEIARDIEAKSLWTSTRILEHAPRGAIGQSPGMRLCVLNVPFGTAPRVEASNEAEEQSNSESTSESTAEATAETSAEATESEAVTEAEVETTAAESSDITTNPLPKPLRKPFGTTPIQSLSVEVVRQCTPVHGVKRIGAAMISGPYLDFIKGSGQKAAVLRPKEGMWEHKRGHKVDGGERRQTEVRAKRRAKERRDKE